MCVMYLSILLDRARYSPPPPKPQGDLDRRWDHTEDLLANLSIRSLNWVKVVTWLPSW